MASLMSLMLRERGALDDHHRISRRELARTDFSCADLDLWRFRLCQAAQMIFCCVKPLICLLVIFCKLHLHQGLSDPSHG